MSDFDLVIRHGTVATAADTTVCDIAIKEGVIATLGKGLGQTAFILMPIRSRRVTPATPIRADATFQRGVAQTSAL